MISKDLEKIFNEAESQKNNGNFSEAIKLFLNILKFTQITEAGTFILFCY